LEHRMNNTFEWNRYILVAVDGTLKLSVNGKFVNGIRSPKRKKGYICPESEGAEIHFRKIDIMELPGSVISEDQIAPIVG
ncbi:MAG: family 16 glycoside hydrolase, partial [Balneolaceae bacterium]